MSVGVGGSPYVTRQVLSWTCGKSASPSSKPRGPFGTVQQEISHLHVQESASPSSKPRGPFGTVQQEISHLHVLREYHPVASPEVPLELCNKRFHTFMS
ncbi:hypothetical protein J6590_008885 [Homalodisca vitripennis]|nr:hypothetical protein J6590_008885 [Homalodisca vitripennis]